MTKKIVIDPITRIEGHLKIETEINHNVVTSARASAQMFRGIESALIGYDARVAQQVTQRVCGFCPYAHAEAAAKALEDAMGIKPNKNGQLLRNLIMGAYQLQDHILHFYQLCALDFIDVAAVLNYRGKDNDLNYVKNWIITEQKSTKIYPLAPFFPRYKADYCDDQAVNISAIKHYCESLPLMSDLHKMVAIFGGKSPHTVTIEAGGVTTTPTVLSIAKYRTYLLQVEDFIKHKYTPDIIAVAKKFKNYFKEGKGYGNLLSFSQYPDTNGSNSLFSDGITIGGRYLKLDLDKIHEDHTYAYYKNDAQMQVKPLTKMQLEPLERKEFEQQVTDSEGKYSWSKAPRYDGYAMEVGPVARLVNTYLSKRNSLVTTIVDKFNRELGITIKDYASVMGRHLSRAVIANVLIEQLKTDIENVEPGVNAFVEHDVPKNARGVGLIEASRGALGHWIRTDKNGYILKYDMIVPSTWNISPRNAKKNPGPVEKMLIGTKVQDEKNPIELARIVRSTDPCIACSVH